MLATSRACLITVSALSACCVLALACGGEDDPKKGPATTSSSSSTGAGGDVGGSGTGGGTGGDTGVGGSLATYCDTVDLATHAGDTPSVPPETVASGIAFPRLIALDANQVYVADSTFDSSDGTIVAMPKAGGAPEQLAATGVNNASGLGVAGGYVYWSNVNNTNLMRVAVSGGGEEVFFPSGPLDTMTVSSQHVFAGTNDVDGGYVYAYPLDGSDPYTVLNDLTVSVALATFGSHLYAADLGVADVAELPNGRIIRSGVDGSDETDVATGQNRLLALRAEQGGTVVWLDGGTVNANFADGAIHLLSSHCGASPVTIVTGIDTGWTVTMHDTEVIWAGFDGRVWGLDLTSGDLTLYGDDGGQALGVAADATHVYWTDAQAGQVRRAPR